MSKSNTLYKAKLYDSDEWTIGNLIQNEDKSFIVKKEKYSNTEYVKDGIKLFSNLDEIIPNTICQYTNLETVIPSDFGVLIFENDIVRYKKGKSTFIGVVTQEAGAWGICSKDTICIELENSCYCDNFISFWELMWNSHDPDCLVENYVPNIEIIGNIYNNPEILNESTKEEITKDPYNSFKVDDIVAITRNNETMIGKIIKFVDVIDEIHPVLEILGEGNKKHLYSFSDIKHVDIKVWS